MKEFCLECHGELFEKVTLDDKGHVAIDDGSKVRFETEGEKKFFVCPHCGARNVIVAFTSKDGVPQMRITHAEKPKP